jgi:putative addiction module antidote
MTEHVKKPENSEGYVLQVRKLGNSVGLILPKDLLARLNLKEGDKLHVVEQSGSTMRLSPYDPDFAQAMEIARKGMKAYRNALAELAK